MRRMEWSEISDVKEKLKKLGFKWDGERWVGSVRSPTVVAVLRRMLGLSREEYERVMATLSNASTGGDLVVVEGELPDLLRLGVVESDGEAHVVSVTRIVREMVRADRNVARRAATYGEYLESVLGEVREKLLGLAVVGDVESAISNARAMLAESASLAQLFARRVEWRVATLDRTSATLNFLPRDLADRLRAMSISYNVVTREGEVIQRPIRLVRVERGEKVTLRFPVFLRDRVRALLEEAGYVVREAGREARRVELRSSVRLRPFQEEALARWEGAGYRGTIVVPTGGGKTFIGLAAIARLGVPTVVLVVTRELAAQWVERIRRYLGHRAGLLGGGSRELGPITVAIYNSAVKYIDELKDRYELAVFDEAHHVPAETFKEVALRLEAPYRLALSATPDREDGNEHLVYEAVGPPVYRADYWDMVREGLAVPIRHVRVYVDLDEDERAEYERLARQDNPILLRNLASRARAKIDVVRRIASSSSARTIVFAQFVEQAEEVWRALREVGVRAVLVTGESAGRDRAFGEFRSGRANVLVSTTVLDEGVDVPDAEVAIVVSGTGSRRQMVQRAGRVVRAAPGKREAVLWEVVARNTIEEALSNERHVRGIIGESACVRVLARDLEKALRGPQGGTLI